MLEQVDTEAFQAVWAQLHGRQSEIGMSSMAALQYCQVGAHHDDQLSSGDVNIQRNLTKLKGPAESSYKISAFDVS